MCKAQSAQWDRRVFKVCKAPRERWGLKDQGAMLAQLVQLVHRERKAIKVTRDRKDLKGQRAPRERKVLQGLKDRQSI